MKSTFTLLLFFIQLSVFAQQDNHSRLLDEKKLQCERILAELSGKPESIDLLIKAGGEGLKIARDADHEYKFSFHQAIGTGYYYKQNFNPAKEHFEQAYQEATKANLTEKSLNPLGNLISIYHYLGLQSKADEAAQNLKQILETTGTKITKSDGYYNLGMYNQQQKFYYSIALSDFLKSVELQKPTIDTTKILKLKLNYSTKLMMVAEVYLCLKQPEKALQYLNEMRPYLNLSMIIDIAAYGRFVRSYGLLKNQKEALKYYNLLYQTAAKTSGRWSQLVSSNLTMATLALDNKAYPLAKAYIDKADKQSKLDNNEMLTSSVNLHYGDYYKRLNDNVMAAKYYKASEHGSAMFNKEQYLDLLKSLTAVEISSGNMKDAGAYYDKYVTLSDSLTTHKIASNLAEMEAIFQNKNKQQQIDAQNIQLTYAKRQRLWLIGGLSLISLIAVLLIVIYRNKKRTADLLNGKNKTLARLNADLEEANQTKAKLFSIISHDLRSPINQVYQFLKLQQLNPKLLTEIQKAELSGKIQTATSSLLETMEELLLWSKSQMNQFKTEIQPTDLQNVLKQSIQLMELNIEAKNIDVVNELSSPVVVQTDPYFVQTVVRNLMQNAIKASPTEGVIGIKCVETQNKAVLSIRNSGSPFTQQHYNELLASTENGLSGLGLKLIDEFSRKTGTEISFENPGDDLTQVNLTFPK